MKQTLGRLLGLELVFVLLWNSGFIGAEYGLPYAGPWSLLFWRYVALSVLLGGFLGMRGRLGWPGVGAVSHTAVCGVLAHGVWLGCVLVALERGVPAGIVALVTALQPLLTGTLSGPLLGERTSVRQWVGLVLGFLGVVVAVGARLSADATTPAVGYLIPFGSVLGITAASLLQRHRTRRGGARQMPADLTLFYQSVATMLAMMVPAWLLEGFAADWKAPFIATMAWLVLAVSLGAYGVMWRLLAQKDATRVASLFYLSPPVTMVMAWVAFGDGLLASDLVGLAVAGAGVLLVFGLGTRKVRVTEPVAEAEG